MFDAALIQQCADPGIEIAIVERFIAEAGSDNPLKVTITSGNRVILPEAPKNADQALRLIQHFVSQATVRVGITQYPAGYGVSDAAEIAPAIVDTCENIRMGTALFGKVYRIVAHATGGNDSGVFAAAINAWRTGLFQNEYVFGLPDPGPRVEDTEEVASPPGYTESPEPVETDMSEPSLEPTTTLDPNQAGIRVDLSGYEKGAE